MPDKTKKCVFPPCQVQIPEEQKPPFCQKHSEWHERWLFNLFCTDNLRRNMAQKAARDQVAPKLFDADGNPLGGMFN